MFAFLTLPVITTGRRKALWKIKPSRHIDKKKIISPLLNINDAHGATTFDLIFVGEKKRERASGRRDNLAHS